MVKLNHYVGAFVSDVAASTYVTAIWGAQALVEGLLYRNTGTSNIRIYTGSSWVETGGGAVNLDVNEIFSGPGATFTLTLNYIAGTTQVYLNGLRQELGMDYTEGPGANQITFSTATLIGDTVVIDYQT